MAGETVLLYEQLKDYDFVRFTWSDMHGISRGISTARRNVQGLLESGFYAWRGVNGMGTDSSLVLMDEVNAEGNGNMCLKPRSGTAHALTFCGSGKYKVGEVLCNSFMLDGSPARTCTANAALTQIANLEKKGLKILSAFEMEYTLYNATTKKPAYGGTDMFSHLVLSEIEDYVYDLDRHLEESGVELECLHTEWGAGQVELTFKPQWGIKMADNAFIFKEAAKEVAHQKGYQAVFMSKPEAKTMTNGGHLTHSVWDSAGRNLFTDADSLSEFGYHWLAGLCKHAAALTVLCSPTANCFRRLNKPWVPNISNWGFDNRQTSFRAKAYGPKGACIENRLPGCAFNPYLALAGTIAAGLDGVENKLECPPQCPPDGSTGGTPLPKTLAEGLEALQKDDVMVNAIGADLVRWFVKTKMQTEVAALPHFDHEKIDPKSIEKEFELYARLI